MFYIIKHTSRDYIPVRSFFCSCSEGTIKSNLGENAQLQAFRRECCTHAYKHDVPCNNNLNKIETMRLKCYKSLKYSLLLCAYDNVLVQGHFQTFYLHSRFCRREIYIVLRLCNTFLPKWHDVCNHSLKNIAMYLFLKFWL